MITPMFCSFCSKYRHASPTFLNDYETKIYEATHMCSYCLEWVNDPSNKEIIDELESAISRGE